PGADIDSFLGALGAAWAAGQKIDWQAFYRGNPPGRIALPGYPFERQRFALDFSGLKSAPVAAKDDARKSDLGEWFYCPAWKRTPAPQFERAAQPVRSETAPRCWLIFDDDRGLADAIADRVAQAGEAVVRVRQGDQFHRHDT